MRHLAGIGAMLLALTGCQGLPGLVRIDVDGSTLVFKKKEPPSPEPPAPSPEPDNVADPAP